MKIGLLQLNPTIGDFTANREKLLSAYADAAARGAEFVIAPELFLCGYPPRDLLLREDFVDANLQALEETARQTGRVPLCVGFVEKNPERPGRALKNSAALLQKNRTVHLPRQKNRHHDL
jgi:predicted amidohydrolase